MGSFWGLFEGVLGAIFGVWVSGLPGQPIGLDWVGCWVMVVLGWGHFGGTLGTFWGHVGDVLGTLRCWGHFGAVLGHFEEFWGILGTF